MGLVVAALSLLVALARAAAATSLRRLLPHVSRASGGLLLLAGMYVVYHGWYELRVFADGAIDDPVVGAAIAVLGVLVNWVSAVGTGWIVLPASGATLLDMRRRRRIRMPGRS
ncbi:hypothetical protein ACFWY5_56470 [Nonomuraea sp. NPDC059007]|uniref:hypothetical protein n=1 Tax=Nonomuraea sp. NPDC059007 TaxID=3346692 RepID=UPI0036C255C4